MHKSCADSGRRASEVAGSCRPDRWPRKSAPARADGAGQMKTHHVSAR